MFNKKSFLSLILCNSFFFLSSVHAADQGHEASSYVPLSGNAQVHQEVSPEEEKGQEKETSFPEKDEIIVLTTRTPRQAFSYPGEVSVITREDIERDIAGSLPDIFRRIPGVRFTGGPRRTGQIPSVRGLRGDNVVILLDGTRQNFYSGHQGRVFVDPGILQTVEIARGPAASLFGSGALGGVIALKTSDASDFLKAGEHFGARLRGGYNSASEEKSVSLTAYAKKGRFEGLGSYIRRQSDNIRLGNGSKLPSRDKIDAGLVRTRFEVNSALTLTAGWRGFQNKALEPYQGQGLSTATRDKAARKTIDSNTWRLGFDVNPKNNPFLNLEGVFYQVDTDIKTYRPDRRAHLLQDTRTRGASFHNQAHFNPGHMKIVLITGAELYEDRQKSSSSITKTGRIPGIPSGKSRFYALYAQGILTLENLGVLPGVLELHPGLRYDNFQNTAEGQDKVKDKAWSPRFAFAYEPVSWFRLFGVASRNFRAPSASELFSEGIHFPLPHPILRKIMVYNRFKPNPALKPQKATSLEVGAALSFRDLLNAGDRLRLKGSVYKNEVKNLIAQKVSTRYDRTCFRPPFFPCGFGSTTYENIDKAELEGFEVSMLYEQERFTFRANLSDTDGKNKKTGKKLEQLPPLRLNLDIGYRWPEYGLSIGVTGEIAKKFDKVADPTLYRKGYAIMGLYAGWKVPLKNLEGLRLDFAVDNLFDKNYEPYQAGVAGVGRNIKIALGYQANF